ncbi:hypothetical protein EJ07DRAFT_159641 [Lizonia empirigonia]|nr:hypothetical protein EJ07DRAFT_159641 [Lizonia empirigonia]
MDVDRDISHYFEALENQKRALQRAKSRQGQRPSDRKPRELMYMQFMMALMATTAKEQREEGHLLHSSFIPPAYLPCTTPLAQLTPIAIRQLTLETHHRGRYLLLRAITPPNRMTAIHVLTEDEHGDVAVLQLYQQDEQHVRDVTDIVDKGNVLLIKEPYFKVMASGEYGLRVDHLSDVLYIDRDEPILPKRWCPQISKAEKSAEISKSKGDSAIGEGKYSRALSQKTTSDRIEVIKRNRSLAFLKTKQFDSALSDTGFPDFGAEPTEKALFRAAEALYFLQRFEDCSRVLRTLCAHFPNNKQASVVSDRAQLRCSEASSGEYDFKLLQQEAKKFQPPQLDHATYIGPVQVKIAPGKGRGLFVTKPIKAGDLILCEKAFSHAYVPETGVGSAKLSLLINPETGKGFMGGQADLIKLIVQKIYRNPSLAPSFTTLHPGAYKPTSTTAVDGRPVVDTFLVEQIMSFNVFGCPQSSLTTHRNSITDKSNKATAYHSCGIWTQASFINHSCTSNARRSFIGDMMIVRATQDLEPGTEITFWYQIPEGDPKKMQEKLRNWQFTCTCAICDNDKATGAAVFAERAKLMKELKRSFGQAPPHTAKLGKVVRLLENLKNTYSRPMDEVPRLMLWDPQALLMRIYMSEGNVLKVLESFQQVLTLLGFIVTGADSTSVPFRIVKWGLLVDYLIEVFLQARSTFETIGAKNDSKTAELYARVAYKMVVGEDTSFESTYSG